MTLWCFASLVSASNYKFMSLPGALIHMTVALGQLFFACEA